MGSGFSSDVVNPGVRTMAEEYATIGFQMGKSRSWGRTRR